MGNLKPALARKRSCQKVDDDDNDLYLSVFHQEDQYARWMAAFRFASKGRTMADSSYGAEVQSISALLSMQRPQPSSPVLSPNDINFQAENYVAPRFFRKIKNPRQV